MSQELSIVIVNWNAGDLLRRCLESVRRHPPAIPYEVIVIDNASSDDSLASAKNLADCVMANSENAGFARANNQAFARSHAPFLFLLNPDAEVTPGAIDTLLATLHADPRNGACGPRLIHADGRLQPSVWHLPPRAWRTLVAGLGLWRLIPRSRRGDLLLGDHWTHDERRSVPMIFGAAVLVRRETIDQVGAFDERFPLYSEDEEWCLRMTRGGWRIVFEPRATIVHHGSASSVKRWDAAGKIRAKQEASILFQRISVSRAQRAANFLAVCVVAAVQMLLRPSAIAPRIVLAAHLRAVAQEVRGA